MRSNRWLLMVSWVTMVVLLGTLVTGTAWAGPVPVRLKLPMKAKIDLTNRHKILPAPFIVVSQEGEGRLRGTDIDVQKEFERYLKKILRRETDLKITEVRGVDYPSYDLEMLSRDKLFWQALGERYGVDLVLTGSIDFDVQDRSGYRTEEFVSPLDGRVYYRQVLVEQTGFEYDIVVMVFDGETGDLLYDDNFKDFKTFEGEGADPLRGMFENLYALENRLLGIFVQKEVEATRLLLTN